MSETKTWCSENPLNNQSPLTQSEKTLKDATRYFQEIYSSEKKKHLLIKRRKKAEKHQKKKTEK